MSLSALLLDLDGTLVDSEPVHFKAHERFLASVGIAVTHADLVGNIGKGDATFYAALARQQGKTADVATWVRGKDQELLRLYASAGVAKRPGVEALLASAWQAGQACVVVTNSDRATAASALLAAGLATRLPSRVCREDTPRHKPDPAPYLLAARRLEVPPAACLAIEDSPSGVRAAVAAGCRVLAVAGLIPAAQLAAAGAHAVAETLVGQGDPTAIYDRLAR